MKQLNPDQRYFVEEFYEDYQEGLLSRRAFIRRLVFITGSMAATVSTMSLLGCSPSELPDPTDSIPPPDATATPSTGTSLAGEPTGTSLADRPTATSSPEPTITSPAVEATNTSLADGPTATSSPQPTDTPPSPSPQPTETTAPQLEPVPGAQSPFTVPEGDPALITSEVAFTSQGDEIMAYLARPAADGVYAGVLVCHENRGLNAHIRDVARRFAKENYVALAIDLLSREGGAESLDSDQVPGLLSQAGAERHVADFVAGFKDLQSLEFVDGERIGMTGYCFGGGITWDVATQLPELKAAVPFYGRSPDLEQVPNIQAAVLGVYAEQDQRINAGIDALEAALTQAGVTYEFKVYPGVNHAFHNDTGSRYVEAQASQAWLDTLDWFERYLRG
jgi:carboxymethylenebutenolidase